MQESFVAEYNCCLSPVLKTVGRCPVSMLDLFAEPVADIAGLDILRRGGDIVDSLGMVEISVDFIGINVQLIGEILQVLADVLACFVSLHIIMVEVPVETSLAVLHQVVEQLLLYLLQQVEAYKQIMAMGVLPFLLLYDLPIKSTLVSQSLMAKPVVEIVVNVGEMTPQSEKALFQFGVVVF